jgi:multisubunit Na+/H+ antiporter MnhE subunit
VWCVTPRRTPPGLVTIPIPPCPPTSAAAWGIRVGITPDTVVVDLDEERGRMLLHVIDARDPDAVRAEQLDSYRRRQRRVFP